MVKDNAEGSVNMGHVDRGRMSDAITSSVDVYADIGGGGSSRGTDDAAASVCWCLSATWSRFAISRSS